MLTTRPRARFSRGSSPSVSSAGPSALMVTTCRRSSACSHSVGPMGLATPALFTSPKRPGGGVRVRIRARTQGGAPPAVPPANVCPARLTLVAHLVLHPGQRAGDALGAGEVQQAGAQAGGAGSTQGLSPLRCEAGGQHAEAGAVQPLRQPAPKARVAARDQHVPAHQAGQAAPVPQQPGDRPQQHAQYCVGPHGTGGLRGGRPA